MQRRTFLKCAGLVPLLAQLPVWAMESPRRALVLIELKGGNDGLNTVIPYADPEYYRLRPTLAVARDAVLPLSEQVAFNPALEALLPAWRAGELALVLGVGYPRPNRSHFRSIDIWETASDRDEFLEQGWIAQLLPYVEASPTALLDAVALGHSGLGPLRGEGARILEMGDLGRLINQARRLRPADSDARNRSLEHLLAVRRSVLQAGDTLRQNMEKAPNPAGAFPETALGKQLKDAAKLLLSGVYIPVIKVAIAGFDTHINQRSIQDRRLQELAEALAAFRKALQAAGLWDQVLVMSYSEFGRRVKENANKGTDHGTAAPHLLLGGRVKGGLYGRQPSLTDLQSDDLRHHVDFRSLYVTVAKRWWGVSSEVWNGRFPILDCIG